MSGRLPYHALQQSDYVSGGMNLLPAKLKQVGYATHQVPHRSHEPVLTVFATDRQVAPRDADGVDDPSRAWL